MKRIDENVFVVKQLSDHSHEPTLGRFKSHEEAKKLADITGGYGGSVRAERLEFIIFDTFEEYMAYNGDELRKTALSKLTKEEKFALGLAN